MSNLQLGEADGVHTCASSPFLMKKRFRCASMPTDQLHVRARGRTGGVSKAGSCSHVSFSLEAVGDGSHDPRRRRLFGPHHMAFFCSGWLKAYVCLQLLILETSGLDASTVGEFPGCWTYGSIPGSLISNFECQAWCHAIVDETVHPNYCEHCETEFGPSEAYGVGIVEYLKHAYPECGANLVTTSSSSTTTTLTPTTTTTSTSTTPTTITTTTTTPTTTTTTTITTTTTTTITPKPTPTLITTSTTVTSSSTSENSLTSTTTTERTRETTFLTSTKTTSQTHEDETPIIIGAAGAGIVIGGAVLGTVLYRRLRKSQEFDTPQGDTFQQQEVDRTTVVTLDQGEETPERYAERSADYENEML